MMFARSFLGATLLLAVSSITFGGEPNAADLLPDTTAVYLEVASPDDLVNELREHPLRKTWEENPTFQKLTAKNPDFLKAQAGLALGEFVVGKKWHEVVHIMAGEQLALAIDAETEGAVALAKSPNGDELSALRDKLIKLARDDAKKKHKPDPLEERAYRGHPVYKADNAVFAVFGDWLVVTNKPDLGRVVADRILDEKFAKADTLGKQTKFLTAKKTIEAGAAVWAYVDINTIRETGLAQKLYEEKSDNPGLELLVGGLLATLRETPYATAAVHLEDDGLRLAYQVPIERTEVAEARRHYFGPAGEGQAPVALNPAGRLASLTAYRDVAAMWLRRADLFDQAANAELAKADSGLTTVFAGNDFGRDILGGLQPQIQLLATHQSFEGQPREPKIKLPAAALVLRLKEPKKMRRQLKVSFQSLIGLTNLGAGQAELPQLELTTEKREQGQLVVASYEGITEEADVSNDIIYNFSPSLAFVGDHFIVASTKELASELYELIANGGPHDEEVQDRISNSTLTVDGAIAQQLLAENREQLIAQNMLEEGHTRRQAEREIDLLLQLAKLAKQASLGISTSEDDLRVEFRLRLQ